MGQCLCPGTPYDRLDRPAAPEIVPNSSTLAGPELSGSHVAEIVAIDGESYRVKEARERTEQRTKQRRGKK